MTGRLRRWLGPTAPDVLIRLGLAAMMALVLVVMRGYSQLGHCMRDYNEAVAQSNGQLREAAAEDRRAWDQMVAGVLDARAPGDSRAALQQYQATRRAADDRRAKASPPPPPSQYCA